MIQVPLPRRFQARKEKASRTVHPYQLHRHHHPPPHTHMPGTAAERVNSAQQREEARKAKKREKVEREKRERTMHAAIILMQCAARRRAAYRHVAEERLAQRTPSVILAERDAEWLAQRREMRKPGFVSSLVSTRSAEQERMRYPWVRKAAARSRRGSSFTCTAASESGPVEHNAPSCTSSARSDLRELSKRHFTAIYVAANRAFDVASPFDPTSPKAKPRSPKRDRYVDKGGSFPSMMADENSTPQDYDQTASKAIDEVVVDASPSMMKRISARMRRMSKEALEAVNLLSA